MTTKNATTITQVNKAIAAKFPHVFLVRGKGYYYIASNDEATGLKIAGLYTSSIGVFSIKHQTVEAWVKDVETLLNQ